MKKRLISFLCIVVCGLLVCGCSGNKDEKNSEIPNNEININEPYNTPAAQVAEEEDVFLLRNATQKDIYSLEFSSNDKENLLIDAVLPAGNEVKIKNSGLWEIKAEFMADDGSYYQESFGEARLDLYGSETVVILSENEQGYFAETQQKK